jgi:hypothetical protein
LSFVCFKLPHPIATNKNTNSPNAICTIGTLWHRLSPAGINTPRRESKNAIALFRPLSTLLGPLANLPLAIVSSKSVPELASKRHLSSMTPRAVD